MQRDAATLLDIVQAAQLIVEFMQGIDRAAFEHDLKTQSAVLHQLMVMGEAVKRLSSELRERYSEIPWTLVAGMRDRLIHGYDAVDKDEVWKTATVDVPNLLRPLRPLVPGPCSQRD
jgi:uncharacterized protein with HEPN domain